MLSFIFSALIKANYFRGKFVLKETIINRKLL